MEQKKTQETDREASLEQTHHEVSERAESLRASKFVLRETISYNRESIEKAVSEKMGEKMQFEHKLQQNQDQKDKLLELIKTNRETCENEIRDLKKAIDELSTACKQLKIDEPKLENDIETVKFSVEEKQEQLIGITNCNLID